MASQTDLTGEEMVPVGARLAELARLRLQYDESRRNVQVTISLLLFDTFWQIYFLTDWTYPYGVLSLKCYSNHNLKKHQNCFFFHFKNFISGLSATRADWDMSCQSCYCCVIYGHNLPYLIAVKVFIFNENIT